MANMLISEKVDFQELADIIWLWHVCIKDKRKVNSASETKWIQSSYFLVTEINTKINLINEINKKIRLKYVFNKIYIIFKAFICFNLILLRLSCNIITKNIFHVNITIKYSYFLVIK